MSTWLHPDPELPVQLEAVSAPAPDPRAATWLNPVAGRIQLNSETWQGAPTFRITQVYHSGHLALDIGNGRTNTDHVSAMRAGRVVKVDPVQGIVGVDHGDGYRTDYAHMSSMGGMYVGLKVSQGQHLGLVDTARDVVAFPSMAPHLHLVMLQNGVAIDPTPFLNQQVTDDDMTPIPSTEFAHVSNRRSNLIRATAALVEPGSGAKYRDLPSGTLLYPVASTSKGYHAAFIYDDAPTGYVLAWFAGGDMSPFETNEITGEPAPPDPEPEPEPDPLLLFVARALGYLGLFLAGISALALTVAILTGALAP